MSFRTEIFAAGQWGDRGFAFLTREEALSYGQTLTRVDHRAYRAVESPDRVNYKYVTNALVPIKPGATWNDLMEAIKNRMFPRPTQRARESI